MRRRAPPSPFHEGSSVARIAAILIVAILAATTSGGDVERNCKDPEDVKSELVDNLLEHEHEIKTKLGAQFQLDCRADYFPELRAATITWQKERRDYYACGVDGARGVAANANNPNVTEEIPFALMRCFKDGVTDDGRTTTWRIGSILQICNVSKIHEGSYVCEVCDAAGLAEKKRGRSLGSCRLSHYKVVLTQPTKFSSLTIFFFAHPAIVPSGVFLFGLLFSVFSAMFCQKPSRTKGGGW